MNAVVLDPPFRSPRANLICVLSAGWCRSFFELLHFIIQTDAIAGTLGTINENIGLVFSSLTLMPLVLKCTLKRPIII